MVSRLRNRSCRVLWCTLTVAEPNRKRFDFPPTYRHTVRLVTLVCVQAAAGADELAEEMLSLVGQSFAEHSDLGVGDLEI